MEKNHTMELFAALLRSSMGDQLAPGTVSFTDMLRHCVFCPHLTRGQGRGRQP
jgi:hypothetical protein